MPVVYQASQGEYADLSWSKEVKSAGIGRNHILI